MKDFDLAFTTRSTPIVETLEFYSIYFTIFLRIPYSMFFMCTFFFFFIYVGCPGQLMRTTTIPHGPLDILQAQEQVRHRGGDRRAHRGSNPGRGRNKSHGWPQQLDPQVHFDMKLLWCDFIFFPIIKNIHESYGTWLREFALK
jgi:hypothetical protein